MIVDNSTLGAFSRCQTYGAFRYWLHRQSKQEGIASVLGSCCHTVAQEYLKGHEIIPAVLNGEYKLKEAAKQSGVVSPDKLEETIAKLHAITGHIVETYPIINTTNGIVIYHPKTRQPRWRVRHVEIAFKLPLNDHHVYTGRLDAVVEDDYGHWNIWEMKTSSFANNKLWRSQWRLSNQPRGYTWAAGLHTLAPVRGAIIVPFGTSSVRCSAEQPIDTSYDQISLQNWVNDTVSYCDWLESIAEECGIAFDDNGRALAPDTEYVTIKSQQVLQRTIATGRYTNACANNAYGTCSYYAACVANYSIGYINNDTIYNVWKPEDHE